METYLTYVYAWYGSIIPALLILVLRYVPHFTFLTNPLRFKHSKMLGLRGQQNLWRHSHLNIFPNPVTLLSKFQIFPLSQSTHTHLNRVLSLEYEINKSNK